MPRTPGLLINRAALLDLLAWCEGTSTSPESRDDGYDIMVGSAAHPRGQHFDGYSAHPLLGKPPILVGGALRSSAAGRYQLLSRYYPPYCEQLHLSDFSPTSQDAIALQQMKERVGALGAIDAGNVEAACGLLKKTWASLPGDAYGQGGKTLAQVQSQWLVCLQHLRDTGYN